MKENEIKLAVSDLNDATEELTRLDASIKYPRHFEDNFVLDTASQSLRNNKMLLRLRISQGKGIVTFKGRPEASSDIKVREEIECEVSDPEKFLQILSNCGFSVAFRYQKYRTIFEIPEVDLHFCLDETLIGNYLELEGDPELIRVYAQRLGYKREDFITASYAGLYESWCQQKGIAPAHMTFS